MTCPDCNTHIAEVNRLRAIIADQDQRILRMHRQRAEFNEQMEHQLAVLTDRMASLKRELNV